jgi:hypothetical protein
MSFLLRALGGVGKALWGGIKGVWNGAKSAIFGHANNVASGMNDWAQRFGSEENMNKFANAG